MTNKQATRPLGVIQALASGFDLVTRHPELMLLPILLDGFLWLGPRLSAYPLVQALINFMNSPDMMAALGPGQSQQMDALQKLLDQAGQVFNLFWWLSPTLLGVPGLMVGDPAQKIPNGAPTVWPVTSGLAYFVLFFVLTVAGLLLSALYWAMLASRVRDRPLSLRRIAALWWGLVKVAVLVVMVILTIGFPTVMVATLVALLSLLAAQFVLMLGGSLLLWALFYLIFTVHGVALRGGTVFRAVRVSVALMRTQFLPAMGLVIMAVAIYIGMGFVWNIPASDSWLRAAGILGHAFTVTGLLAATALFYLDRTSVPESQGAGHM